jgi:predicted house-cleaning NTP pyrophosphatase (Maf/HAM1 superfamily)
MALRLKKGIDGTRILKGSEIIVASESMTQSQLLYLKGIRPDFVEEFDEKLEEAKAQVESYAKTKKKKKDAENNEELG